MSPVPRRSRWPEVPWWIACALPPVAVGGEGQHADGAAEPVVGGAAAQERAVAAVVLDHEQPHEQAGRGHGQEQGEPVGVLDAEQHQRPQGREAGRA
jgi:hypothetical protein